MSKNNEEQTIEQDSSSNPTEKSEQEVISDSNDVDNDNLDLNKSDVTTDEPDPIDSLQARIEALEKQNLEEKDKALRALAELENFKSRKNQEVENFKKFAAEKVIMSFLPVLDSFNLAFEHTDGSTIDSLKEGMSLIQKQFETALDQLSVKSIDALNKPFDPNFHQAISQEETNKVEKDTVIKEVQKGYLLHDRVLRPSMVIVEK